MESYNNTAAPINRIKSILMAAVIACTTYSITGHAYEVDKAMLARTLDNEKKWMVPEYLPLPFQPYRADDLANNKPVATFQLETSIGTIDNVYFVNKNDYLDVTNTLIESNALSSRIFRNIVQTGFQIPTSPTSSLHATYALLDDSYEKQAEDADKSLHEVRLGFLNDFASNQSYLFNLRYEDFDRSIINLKTGDTLVHKSGIDISDKSNYKGFGLEAAYTVEFSQSDLTVDLEVEELNYQDPGVLAQLDQDHWNLGIHYGLFFNNSTRLYLGFRYGETEFDEVQPRFSDGTFAPMAPMKEYKFNIYDIELQHTTADNTIYFLDLNYQKRDDTFDNYNSVWVAHSAAGIRTYFWQNWRAQVSIGYFDMDFNTFNESTPALGKASREMWNLNSRVTRTYSDNLDLFVSVRFQDSRHSDIRFGGERSVFRVGAVITF